MARPNNAALKRLLSRRFPAANFRVYSGRGTARSWSHIDWTDGPSVQLVESFLAEIGAAPGYMDNTDYYNGERISTTRHASEAFRQRVAAALLTPKEVPPAAVWNYAVRRANGGGYYDFSDCVHRAISHRDSPYFEGERFNAHAWYEAWKQGTHEAPSCVTYERVA